MSLKRAIYGDDRSVYIMPSIESTLLVETGGVQDPNPLGKQPDLDLSAAASSGARKFQYNRFFWPNEIFTSNYQNGSIGVAVAYRQNSTSRYAFIIYPITLPRIALSLLSSIQENPSSNPGQRKNLLLQLVYYLNLGFTSYGVGNRSNYSRDSTPATPLNYGPPIVLAKNCKGVMTQPSSPTTLTVNNPVMPIFSDTTAPPLIWDLTGNNQLCLRLNTTYWQSHQSDSIGFNIISLRDYMGNTPNVSYGNAFNSIKSFGTYSFYIPSALQETSGWCSQGAFCTGMTQIRNPDDFSYSDGYTTSQRQALWNDTVFPCYPSASTISFADFNSLCLRNNLATRENGFVIGKFIASLLPSRFISISSNAASRNQKRPFVSNNPTISSSTLNLFFLTCDSVNYYQDSTISSANSTPSSSGYLKNGIDDSSILTMDPMQSMQNMDITIQDEWGLALQNYNQISQGNGSQLLPSGRTEEQDTYLYLEGGSCPINFMSIPVWVAALNPNPSSSESILINENWYCSYNTLFYYNPLYSPIKSYLTTTFQPYTPQSSTIIHFSRILGYS